MKETTFVEQLAQGLTPEQPKDSGEVKSALNEERGDRGSYTINRQGVVTMKKSKRQYQIMGNGAWVRVSEK